MILADRWYASGTLWAVAGVAVALVVGIAGMWVVWRAANPRRRLVYAMPQAVSLINAEKQQRLSQRLEVRHAGVLLKDPHLVTLTLANRGRFDIPSTAFDKDAPLRLDVGTPILEVLEVASIPVGLACPSTARDHTDKGTTVLIGPDKIGRGQQVTIVVLVDGAKPALTCPNNPLIDVQLRELTGNEGFVWPVIWLAAGVAVWTTSAVGVVSAAAEAGGVVAMAGFAIPIALMLVSGWKIAGASRSQ